MTLWDPQYRIRVDGTDVTEISLVGFTINKGRSDINGISNAGLCQINLINFDNVIYPFKVNTSLTIEVKNSAGNYVQIYSGRISDIATEVASAGSTAIVTRLNITALGAIARLNRAIFNGSLSEDTDANQIKTLVYSLGGDQWSEVDGTITWNSYTPTTDRWMDLNAYAGTFDPGVYTMRSQTINNNAVGPIITQIAQSAGGYIYEDSDGRICYADANHRPNELINNGYTDLDAGQALAAGISTVSRQGDLVNYFTINHGVNFSSSHTSENAASQAEFGLYGQSMDSVMKNSADVANFADRVINLRAYPFDRFQSVTFALQSTQIDDADRDGLLGIYMGQPIRITNLPANITEGQFSGFVEGWSFRSTVNGLALTINASPTSFSAISERWNQVNVAEQWNTLNTSLKWEYAIGVIS